MKLVGHIVRIYSSESGGPLAMSELGRLIHVPVRLVNIALLSKRHKAELIYLPRQSGLANGNLFWPRGKTGGVWVGEH